MNFSKNSRTRNWDAEVMFRGAPVAITIDAAHAEADCEALAVSALKLISESWDGITGNILRTLHPLYNDTWSSPEDGFPQLSAIEFLKKIHLQRIELGEEPDSFSLYFSDSDLFGGHRIEVFSYQGKMHDAELLG